MQVSENKEIPRYQQNVADGEGYSFLDTYTGGDSEGGCNGGEYSNYNVKDFTPDAFIHKL